MYIAVEADTQEMLPQIYVGGAETVETEEQYHRNVDDIQCLDEYLSTFYHVTNIGKKANESIFFC